MGRIRYQYVSSLAFREDLSLSAPEVRKAQIVTESICVKGPSEPV